MRECAQEWKVAGPVAQTISRFLGASIGEANGAASPNDVGFAIRRHAQVVEICVS